MNNNDSGKRNKTHGVSYSSEYRVWVDMKIRCYDINNKRYKDYGGRGIKICDRWLNKENGLQNFLNDMGKKPSSKYSIERINNNGDYVPENCRWATMKEQGCNRRNSRYITYKGKTQILIDWCNELNLLYETIRNRLYLYGWSIEEAFETPIGKNIRKREYNGESLNLREWSLRLNIPYKYLSDKVSDLGLSIEQTIRKYNNKYEKTL